MGKLRNNSSKEKCTSVNDLCSRVREKEQRSNSLQRHQRGTRGLRDVFHSFVSDSCLQKLTLQVLLSH